VTFGSTNGRAAGSSEIPLNSADPLLIENLRVPSGNHPPPGRDRAEREEVSVAYCYISHWVLFSSLVLTTVALVLALRDSAKASLICLGFVLLQVVVASLAYYSCPR
jgi:hypothetical protein